MAAKFVSVEYVFPGAAPVMLSSIINAQEWLGTVSFRASDANTGDVYIGDNQMTPVANRGVYLNPGDAWSFDLVQKFVYSDNIYVIGSLGDRLHLVWLQ